MSDILVLVETKSGKIKKTSFELLSEASRLASQTGGSVKALLIGSGVSALAPETGAYGAAEAHVADHASLEKYNVERFASAISEAVKKTQPAVVLATASSVGRDVMPRIAARFNTGMMSECTKLTLSGDKLVGTRPIYAGKCFVDV